MRGRQEALSTVISADEWSTSWRCRCGYGNAGRERCVMCGAAAPESVQGSPGLYADLELSPPPREAAEPVHHAARKAAVTVAGIVLLNLVLQGIEIGIFIANHVELRTQIRISLFTGLAFYAVVTVWVLLRSARLGIVPRTGRSSALHGAAEGFVVGGVMATLLFAVLRLAEGHAVLDPTVSLLANNGSVAAVLLGVVLVVVTAPLVEEIVFRGFLAEALRGRGKAAAVLVSAAAFSLAHLRLAQFRYYAILGIALALVYWRRGLVGSVTTHATFNGMLIVLALAAGHGPAFVASASTSRVSIPATYTTSTALAGDDLVAIGPLGDRAEFAHADLPIAAPPANQIADALAHGEFPFPPEISVDTTRIDIIDLPAGMAASAQATVEGKPGRIVILPSGDRIWIAVFRSAGSANALGDFDDMLVSWRIPPTS